MPLLHESEYLMRNIESWDILYKWLQRNKTAREVSIASPKSSLFHKMHKLGGEKIQLQRVSFFFWNKGFDRCFQSIVLCSRRFRIIHIKYLLIHFVQDLKWILHWKINSYLFWYMATHSWPLYNLSKGILIFLKSTWFGLVFLMFYIPSRMFLIWLCRAVKFKPMLCTNSIGGGKDGKYHASLVVTQGLGFCSLILLVTNLGIGRDIALVFP